MQNETKRKGLTGHSNMAVGLPLINHIHDLIGARDKALGASLRTAETNMRRRDIAVIFMTMHSDSYLHIWNPVLILVDGQVGFCHLKSIERGKHRYDHLAYYSDKLNLSLGCTYVSAQH